MTNNDVFNGLNSIKVMILPVQYLQMNLHFNTVRRWAKHQNDELKRIPKNRQKVHIWE